MIFILFVLWWRWGGEGAAAAAVAIFCSNVYNEKITLAVCLR
jgi:hypothetical protein